MYKRTYKSRRDYLAHQASKTSSPSVRDKLRRKHEATLDRFRAHFAGLPEVVPVGTPALCLGARLGEEVEVLRELGYPAIGVDLVPSPPLVVQGDFEALPFPDATFGLAYSNAVDHVYDLERFAAEIARVLVPLPQPAWVLLHLNLGGWGDFECLRIDGPEELLTFFPGFSTLFFRTFEPDAGGLNAELLLTRSVP
jgi:SAM-dependent methyltransferase